MQVTISKLRQDLFRLVERAMNGEPIEFVHKGVNFRITPQSAPDKLSGLVRQAVVAPGGNAEETSKELFKQMEAEWQQDWAEL